MKTSSLSSEGKCFRNLAILPVKLTFDHVTKMFLRTGNKSGGLSKDVGKYDEYCCHAGDILN